MNIFWKVCSNKPSDSNEAIDAQHAIVFLWRYILKVTLVSEGEGELPYMTFPLYFS